MEEEKQTSQYRLSLTKNVGVSKDSHVLSKMMSKAFKERMMAVTNTESQKRWKG